MKKPTSEPEIATLVSSDGITVYLTRGAIGELIDQLQRLEKAEPEDCFELHLGMHFSLMDDHGQRQRPTLVFADDNASAVEAIRKHSFQQAMSRGEIERDAKLEPFEVTLMHVSHQAIRELSKKL